MKVSRVFQNAAAVVHVAAMGPPLKQVSLFILFLTDPLSSQD